MHERRAADMSTLESVSTQQDRQQSIINPQLNNRNNVNQNFPRTGDSGVRSRSSCNVVPYVALLMMASLLQTSVASGSFEVRWRR